ncbi:hypothetical protein A2870_02480 [Candidatus Curtissbacteria bacterium RIFCSPHIGHO2_01_FULL_41_11]|uniref:Uncharacterized protein n=1 Tax=Candidatus Curtissbacteria bacterium RIFCSPHIGHO2_01_FULL_41_11 TaxID=1797711 RepID=A0A1F5G8M7_9BACT|nr:MAG: hypothetical protein A2870_02480 [Candidatus Curtissbacteria bacterium RIFCSPHIGHO2_01_FULL_41_11]
MSERVKLVPNESEVVAKRRGISAPVRYVGSAALAIFVGYGAGNAYNDVEHYLSGGERALDPHGSRLDLGPALEFIQSLDSYFLRETALIEKSRVEFRGAASPSQSDLEERDKLIQDGLTLLSKVDSRLKLDSGKRIAIYDGVSLSLDNEYHKLLLDAMTFHSLFAINPILPQSSREHASSSLENIVWLMRQDMPINIEPGKFIFLKEGQFTLLANYYRTIFELRHPMPKEISFRVYQEGDPGSGWYGGDGRYVVTTTAGINAAIHEDGHLQSSLNKGFSQSNFDNLVQEAIERSKTLAGDLSKAYVNLRVVDLSEESRKVEDYAETHDLYFSGGDKFRALIRRMKVDNPRAVYVLEAKYQDRKNFFGGKEFYGYGEVFEPEIGDIFVLDDPDNNKPGIFLRTEPTFTSDAHVAVTFHNSFVKIVDGPVEAVDKSGNKRRMYKVIKVERASGPNSTSSPSYMDISEPGWMSAEWFDFKYN